MAGMEKVIFQVDEYQPTAINCRSRQAALWRQIWRNEGVQCAINLDCVIVLSTVWRFGTIESH
jgi:hypothetical protein